MKRFALILEGSRVADDSPIDGCKRDAGAMESWLTSPAGGAWEKEEVEVVHNPWQFEIDSGKAKLDAADFAIVTFSGHGHLEQTKDGLDQRLVIGSGNGPKDISLSSLYPNAPKSIVMIDACRKIEPAPVIKMARAFTFNERIEMEMDRNAYRAAYEKAIQNANDGRFLLMACSVNEFAGEDNLNGGLFTHTLLEVARNWCLTQSGAGICTIGQAFDAAEPVVTQAAKQRGRIQRPKAYRFPDRILRFPFAVKV